MPLELLQLSSDEEAQKFVGKKVSVQLFGSGEELFGTVLRAHSRGFVLETDKGRVKCMWQYLRSVEGEPATFGDLPFLPEISPDGRSRLKVFLYLLMRDSLPFGEVNRLIGQVEACGNKAASFSAREVAAYADKMVERILGSETKDSCHKEPEVVSHYIEKCRECGATISQCRCPSKDKEVRYGLCAKCKQIQREPVRPPSSTERCKLCGIRPAAYEGWCSECTSDHDL